LADDNVMATTTRRRVAKQPFDIHEDEPMATLESDTVGLDPSTRHQGLRHEDDVFDDDMNEEALDEEEEKMGNEDSDCDSDSSDDLEPIDPTVQQDMDKLQATFGDFKNNYQLIKRIGEGQFSHISCHDVSHSLTMARQAHSLRFTRQKMSSTTYIVTGGTLMPKTINGLPRLSVLRPTTLQIPSGGGGGSPNTSPSRRYMSPHPR
jgi:hypothetical protein